mgnify:FL=1
MKVCDVSSDFGQMQGRDLLQPLSTFGIEFHAQNTLFHAGWF